MPDDTCPPCHEWLGLEPADLEVPHRLLGLAADELDPLAIVRAADRQLSILRAVPPDRADERDPLLAQVEAARDAMLALAVATRSVAPPPVPTMPPAPPAPPAGASSTIPAPPPVPPPVPPADEDGGSDGVRIARARIVRRDRPDHAANALGISAFVLVVAVLVAYVAWPYVQNTRKVARRPDPGASPNSRAPSPPRPQPAVKPEPKPAPKVEPKPAPRPQPKPAPTSEPRSAPIPEGKPETKPEPRTEPPPPPEPEPPPVDVGKVRALVDTAVAKAFDALRRHDFAVAKRELEAVADRALDDQQATDRLQRWQQFAAYAQEYPGYRDKALASAASTAATYDLGARQIGVVELNAKEFVYRDSRRPGQNLRVSRDAIPPDVEAALVETWFAKDGRAANHLFLGAAALARREPDLGAARREWQAAANGGEPAGRLLLELLDDPAVQSR